MKPKLVIANNQRQEFVDFHTSVQADEYLYDYVGYESLLFEFAADSSRQTVMFYNTAQDNKRSDEYSGVYLNGYLSTVELATTAATVLDSQGIDYVNKELGTAPSLTKLSSYAKLAAASVAIPHTFGGAAVALLAGIRSGLVKLTLPLILKRADADRGIDNYKFDSYDDIVAALRKQPARSIWVLQDFIPNDGFYLVSIYHSRPEFAIFRAMGQRSDGRQDKSHMFKPKGGENAELLEISNTPQAVVDVSLSAATTMNRQIASVDSLYDLQSKKAYVLEVNYNPQLVTITTFKDVRRNAFLRAVKQIGE